MASWNDIIYKYQKCIKKDLRKKDRLKLAERYFKFLKNRTKLKIS